MNTTPMLPDKLSDLGELALADLAKVETDKRYVVNMGLFHVPDCRFLCHVCFAGAVIAGTLGGGINQNFNPRDFDEETRNKLLALDCLRMGQIDDALSYTGQMRTVGIPYKIKVDSYSNDPTAWRADMNRIIALLRAHGL